VTPYYDHAGVTIYHGDCGDVISELPKADAVITDPPYGINMAQGFRSSGRGFGGHGKRTSRRYEGDWDRDRPPSELLLSVVNAGKKAILWGGNYFADVLPRTCKWLVWDKQQTMPSFSDAELAWTNLSGVAVKMFRLCGAGIMAIEKKRFHPTQKPVDLMQWCVDLSEAQTIIDPFMGSGSTLVAAKNLGRRAIGVERDERFCEVAAKRLSQEVFQFT
jgi:DNA modification methylase